MLSNDLTPRVFLAAGSTDMRKSIDGLASIVQYGFELDPFDPGVLFVFCNRDGTKLKILRWDHNGFWLYYRRLERGRFRWPKSADDAMTISISRRQLQWLLDGLATEQPRAHSAVNAKKIA